MQKKYSMLAKRSATVWEKSCQSCLVATALSCRKQHPLPIKRAERTHAKPNLMRLKVAKYVKMLLFPTEKAVKVWAISYSLPTKEAMTANGKP